MDVTKKKFIIFKEEMERLQVVWGLVSFSYLIDHSDLDSGTHAQTSVNQQARDVVVELNKEVNSISGDRDIKETALHETLEILLDKLESMVCESRSDEAREEVHGIIQTIINVLRRKNGTDI